MHEKKKKKKGKKNYRNCRVILLKRSLSRHFVARKKVCRGAVVCLSDQDVEVRLKKKYKEITKLYSNYLYIYKRREEMGEFF